MATEHKIILHIEDTDIDAEIVQRALHKHMKYSYRLERAKNMAEAEQLLRTIGNIDVILLDLELPDTNSRLDTFQRLKEAKKDPAIPTIVLTSINDREMAVDMIDDGAGDYVRKSRINDDPESLCDAIEFAWSRQHNLEKLEEEQQQILKEKDNVIKWVSGSYSCMQ